MRQTAPTVALLAAFVGMVSLAAGCNRSTAKDPSRVPKQPVTASIDYSKIRPNELGYIPVIMYHDIGGKPSKRDPALVRPIAAFRKDLELMYAAGFRPVNLTDVLNNDIDVPAGTSPIVLSFDDGRESQFRLIETEKAWQVDPNSAVGILEAFSKEHSDWKMRATFFVLPQSRLTSDVFGQRGLGAQKIAYLLDKGMEIGNHTVHHVSLRKLSADEIQTELAGANKLLLEAAPKASISVVALPQGKFPSDKSLYKYLLKGEHDGTSYEFKGAMSAAYRPMISPAARGFDPLKLERIASRDDRFGVRWWINELKSGSASYPRYVSDGDPRVVSVPSGDASQVNEERITADNRSLHLYDTPGGGGGGGSKPIVGAEGGQKPIVGAPAQKPIAGG